LHQPSSQGLAARMRSSVVVLLYVMCLTPVAWE
jgi:hypothetical protein